MWHLAAESISRFPEVVLTALSFDGYPVSVRQRSPRYDAETGEMRVRIPASVALVPGPANVLAHYHDENLSNLTMIQIKGRVERRSNHWVFISMAFTPPPQGGLKSRWLMAKAMRRTSRRYLDTRELKRPEVNWAVIKGLQRQAELDRTKSS
jgi:hypothetical protein